MSKIGADPTFTDPTFTSYFYLDPTFTNALCLQQAYDHLGLSAIERTINGNEVVWAQFLHGQMITDCEWGWT